VDGTQTVFADNGTNKTGTDSAIPGAVKGFVITPSSHYTWQTPSGQYFNIPDAPITLSVSLLSDGDFPLSIVDAEVSAAPSGSLTGIPNQGTVAITSNGCGPTVAPGTSCAFSVIYDPSTIRCTPSPY